MKRLVPFCVFVLWLMFLVSASAWAAGAIVIGPGTLPGWHANSQVKLGWNFYDPANPQDSSPLPKWCKAIGDIPVWDYEADRTVWEQPGQWYIRIPNLVNENPVKHLWISWVYQFDPDTPGPRCFTNIDWFPDSGYGNHELIEEWFDSGGNPTANHSDAAYARITLNVDLYPNPNFEDIWLGTAGSMMVLEVYVKTLCVDACEGDFDHDDDVDGSDLAQLVADPCLLQLSLFAADFGRIDCPCFTQQAHIKGYSNSGCLDMSEGTLGEYPGCGEDEIIARVEGNSIFVTHMNATYNCCPDDIDVKLSSQGSILRLDEKEILTTPCDCMCCYNIYTEIAGLTPGEYTIEVCWQDWETHGELCRTVEVIVP